MGMRFRKSFKIAPGVKLNLSKRGIGVSAGVKGARVSLNSKGRVTKSVGIPGTGISYVSSSKLGASKKKATTKKTSAKASTAFAAENPSADTTPTPPVSDNSSPTRRKNEPEKHPALGNLYRSYLHRDPDQQKAVLPFYVPRWAVPSVPSQKDTRR